MRAGGWMMRRWRRTTRGGGKLTGQPVVCRNAISGAVWLLLAMRCALEAGPCWWSVGRQLVFAAPVSARSGETRLLWRALTTPPSGGYTTLVLKLALFPASPYKSPNNSCCVLMPSATPRHLSGGYGELLHETGCAFSLVAGAILSLFKPSLWGQRIQRLMLRLSPVPCLGTYWAGPRLYLSS